MKHARNPRLVLASGLCALVMSADCGGGEKSEPAPAAAAPSATTNAINPMPRDRVQDGGKLTWAVSSIPPNFNYYHLDGSDYDNYEVISALMPTVYLADAAGTPHWNRNYLAAEPTLVTTPAQTVTYQIHPKAVWSDGTPITWQDFHWQWRASNGTNKAYEISASNGYDAIANVARGKDDREVVVTFAHNYADWQAIFNPFYPASTTKDPKTFNAAWKEKFLATAGPFQPASIDKTAKTITLVRNENWWGDRAKLDTIVYRAIELDAQIDALANGEIDFIDVGPDVNKFQRSKAIGNVEIRTAGGPNFRHLTLNSASTNLQDVRVRRAVAMGIDRATIARALIGPLGIQPTPLGNHIFMQNHRRYQDNSADVGRHDPTSAAQLLDEAGWKLDGNVRKKDGKPLEITIVIPAAVATSRQESELLQNMLAKIGVTLRINTVPLPDFFDKYIRPGRFDLTVFSWIGTAFPVSSAKSIYVRPTKNASGEFDVQQNYGRTGSEEIDRLFSEATQELDPVKAGEIINRADAAIWQLVHSLPFYQRPELYACKKPLANLGAKGFADLRYEDIGWAK